MSSSQTVTAVWPKTTAEIRAMGESTAPGATLGRLLFIALSLTAASRKTNTNRASECDYFRVRVHPRRCQRAALHVTTRQSFV